MVFFLQFSGAFGTATRTYSMLKRNGGSISKYCAGQYTVGPASRIPGYDGENRERNDGSFPATQMYI